MKASAGKKISLEKFREVAEIVKSDDRYDVYDIKMDNLVASMTVLHSGKETTGHSHDADEVYFFVEGGGKIQLGDEKQEVARNDIILIHRGCFHKVFNNSSSDLIFICVFEKYEGRK
ncbi:MAG: cupin domain-containing protein [Candidatus Hydrothermarchaeaceae archaeon]